MKFFKKNNIIKTLITNERINQNDNKNFKSDAHKLYLNSNLLNLYKTCSMNRIAFVVIYPILKGISILPFSLLYLLSDIISFILFYFLGYRGEMIRKNILLSFPEKSIKEIRIIERAFYTHMCDIFLEMIKSMSMTLESINKRFKVNNINLLTQFSKNKRSVIIMCGHYASYEWLLFKAKAFGSSTYGIYTPLTNIYFDKLVKKIRQKHNAFLISRYHTLETIKEHQKNKHTAIYGFAADQSPFPKEKTYWRLFMGNKVPVFTGAERIAKEFNIAIVYADIKRVKRGFYETNFKLVSDSPKQTIENEITDVFYNMLEETISSDPSQYLWSHNRYKYMDKAPK
jgi:KDO2-lipid IV(A) lauroyltransferase